MFELVVISNEPNSFGVRFELSVGRFEMYNSNVRLSGHSKKESRQNAAQ